MDIPGVQFDAAANGVPQVLFHGFLRGQASLENSYGPGNIDESKNVTQYVTSAKWTHSVQDPYETIDLELSGPESRLQQILPGQAIPGGDRAGRDGYQLMSPDCGFWAVLYLPNTDKEGRGTWSAVAWGKSSKMSFTIQTNDDGVLTFKLKVSFESWVATLKKSSIFLAPGSTYIREGYSFDFRSWADEMTTLMQGYVGAYGGVQDVFKDLFRSMLFCFLPNTLARYSGGFYAEDRNGNTTFRYGATADERVSYMNRGEIEYTQEDLGIVERGDADKRPYLFSDLIAFCGTREDCMVYAPLRMSAHKSVTGDGIGSLGSIFPRGSQWSFFQSTFFPIVEAIECFPSLEWPVLFTDGTAQMYHDSGNFATSDSLAVQQAYADIERELALVARDAEAEQRTQYWLNGLDGEKFFQSLEVADPSEGAESVRLNMGGTPDAAHGTTPAPFNGAPEELAGVESLEAGAIQTLEGTRSVMCQAMGGSMPVLIYRMKPKMFSPINQETMTALIRAGRSDTLAPGQIYKLMAAVPASQRTGRNQGMECVFPHPNCKTGSGAPDWLWYAHADSETYKIQWSLDDNTRNNGMYTKTPIQPNSQMELHGMFGEVLVDNESVSTHGLRMKTVDWPFFPAGLTDDLSEQSLANKIETLNEELFAVCGETRLYGRASIEVVYKPWIKAGFWTTGMFPSGTPIIDPQVAASTPDFSGDITGAEGFPGWSGYIEEVTHVVRTLPDGRITKRTVLSLSDYTAMGFGRFIQQFGYRPQSYTYADNPFVWRDGTIVVGHIRVDSVSGESSFVEGLAPSEQP